MLHIIGQMRNMFMASVVNYQTSPDVAMSLDVNETSVNASETLPEDQATIHGVTAEQARNLWTAISYFQNYEKGSALKTLADGFVNPTPEQKVIIQEINQALIYLGFIANPVPSDRENFTSATKAAVIKFQTEKGIEIDGAVGPGTFNALMEAVNTQSQVSAVAATTGEESIAAVMVESVLNDYSWKKIADMSDFEKKALQRDINSLLEQKGEALITVDGKVGPGTRGALESLGYSEDSLVVLRNAAQTARNTTSLETSSTSIENYTEEKGEIDRILNGIFLSATTDEWRLSVIRSLASLTDIADGQWTPENKTRRLVVAQYITDSLATLVDAGKVSAIRASQVIEGLLAQEKFESAPGREAISRMLGTIPELIASTTDESGQEISAHLDKSAALSAIMNSQEPMDMGVSLERGFFKVAGQEYDIDRAEDMFIVTGNGNQRVSIRDTGALKLTNVAIVGNVLVGLMGNGCEGNVVYIPLDTNPQAPRARVPRQQVVPGTPQEPVIPEPEGPRPRRICSLITNTWILVYPDGIRVDTGEKCRDTPGGGGGENGKVSTNPDDSDTDAGEDTGTEGGEGND